MKSNKADLLNIITVKVFFVKFKDQYGRATKFNLCFYFEIRQILSVLF